MKKILLVTIILLLSSFYLQAEDQRTKCTEIKGMKEKLKCIKEKYESFRESVPKSGNPLKKVN
tara:strand:+ start:273 stop:461 length:189 start_codon:yes stop_codon:yes gene_type:complete